MEKIIKETVLGQVVVCDLDLVVVDNLLGHNPEDHDYEWVDVPHNFSWIDGNAISIEDVQKTIDSLKTIGATHVRIMSHCDHRAYYFSGIKLEVMGVKEAKEYKKTELEKKIAKILNDEKDRSNRINGVIDKMKNKLENL